MDEAADAAAAPRPAKNWNRALTDALVAEGLSEPDAVDQIERVLGAIAGVIVAGKTVRLPAVGTIKPNRKRKYVPGTRERQMREEVRAALKSDVLLKGDPFEVEPREKAKVSISPMRYLS